MNINKVRERAIKGNGKSIKTPVYFGSLLELSLIKMRYYILVKVPAEKTAGKLNLGKDEYFSGY